MLMDLDEEFLRKGNFDRVYPLNQNTNYYEQYFENKRYQNALVSAYMQSSEKVRNKVLAPKHKRIYFSQV